MDAGAGLCRAHIESHHVVVMDVDDGDDLPGQWGVAGSPIQPPTDSVSPSSIAHRVRTCRDGSGIEMVNPLRATACTHCAMSICVMVPRSAARAGCGRMVHWVGVHAVGSSAGCSGREMCGLRDATVGAEAGGPCACRYYVMLCYVCGRLLTVLVHAFNGLPIKCMGCVCRDS